MILTAHPIVNTSRMTWSEDTKMFLAEASDIGPMTRVYDDACDVGLTLQSQYVGRPPIVFVVTRTLKRDGEVVGWVLSPADNRDRGFKVKIFND